MSQPSVPQPTQPQRQRQRRHPHPLSIVHALHDRRIRTGIDAQLSLHPLQRWAATYAAAVLPAATLQLDQLCAPSVPSQPDFEFAAAASASVTATVAAATAAAASSSAVARSAAAATSGASSGSSRLLSVSRRWEESFGNSRAWHMLADMPSPDDDMLPPHSHPAHERADGSLTRGSTLSMDLSQACGGSELATGHGDHSIRVWTLGQQGARLRHTMAGHARTPCCVRYHPMLPHLLASADLAGHVAVWDTQAGVMLGSFHCAASTQSAVQERVASISWFPSTSQLCLGFVCGRRCFLWMLLGPDGDAAAAVAAQQDLSAPLAELPVESSNDASPSTPSNRTDRKRTRRRSSASSMYSPASLQQDKRRKHENSLASGSASLDSASHAPFAANCVPPEPTWSQLSARIRSSLDAEQAPRPVCALKARDSFRFICFHPRGEFLLLADRSPPTDAERTSAHALDYKRYSLHTFTMRVLSLGERGAALAVVAAASTSKSSASSASASTSSSPDSSPTRSAKVELRVLATIPRLLFFSDSGIAVNQHWMAACQWHESDTDGNGGSIPLALRPTLAVFDLRPGVPDAVLGRCLARTQLDPCSFADLTCVVFGSGRGAQGEHAYVAVAYQVSSQRRQRRLRQQMSALRLAMLCGPAAASAAQASSTLSSSIDQPATSASAATAPRRSAFSRSRISALSMLTATGDDSDDDEADAGSARVASSATQSPDAVVAQVTAALEEHTFLSFYSARDLSLLQQYTAPIHPPSRAALLSANALLAHPDPAMGVLAATVSGDIHVFTPAAHPDPAGHDETAAAADGAVADCVALFGRHRLAPYIRAEAEAAAGDR